MERESTGINTQQLEAWKSVIPTLKRSHACIIESFLSIGGSATIMDISLILNKPLHTISGRLTELCSMKVISDSGMVKENPASGRNMTVWALRSARAIAYQKYLHSLTEKHLLNVLAEGVT